MRTGRSQAGDVRIADVYHSREQLEAKRQEMFRRLASLTDNFNAVVAASRDTNADDEHDPEGATIAFERSQVGALIREAELRIAEIDAAVKRLDAGTYGTCEGCGRPIGRGRLRARPAAHTCIKCAVASGRRRS
jgi:RNA polymerase-binding transcription factor